MVIAEELWCYLLYNHSFYEDCFASKISES